MEPSRPNSASLGLLTDLYELTMAYGYWKHGMAERRAVFHVTFRTLPFRGGYAVAAGLGGVIEYLEALRFTEGDLDYLAALTGNDGRPLFDGGFIDYLRKLELACDIDALPEGTLAFPHEPLVRVRGPIGQAQIIETALLNFVNFQTLIATKAARTCLAAAGDPVIEFGLRRAQGIDGGLAASRAAYIGGCDSTSNVLAGRRYGIPVKGTHAHSWVMAFGDEVAAFQAYAEAMPNNCILLVDTYDTLEGVREAVRIGRWLREHGHELAGIRLDSGDLAYLSVAARRILDDSGFPQAVIVASNDLDENVIASLKQQGAKIAVWGVGTKLVTAYDQPALGGVYKLTAIRRADDQGWEYRLKLSEQPAKLSIPGMLNVRRYREGDRFIGDMIFDELAAPDPAAPRVIVDPGNELRRKTFAAGADAEDLLVPIFRAGRRVYDAPPLVESRAHATQQLAALHAGTKRLLNPHEYPAGLALGLHERRLELARNARSPARGSRDPA
ncbi:MAG TPA: nicotinate phosphoribosyltransferase [Opitutaceae bacterium]|nr:nicotinate phosphoribosyltransferase [Opitutaceae bacterium]